ncbi:MAG: ABC transporter ATP-binding protein [Candidatus Coprovivens sp.]
MSEVVLECKNIYKKFRKRKKNLIVLNDISYKFEKNKVYAIVGRSGAGKTTLINILGLIRKPNSGEILLNGRNVTKLSERVLAKIRNKNIGFVFQSFYLNPLMTAAENIELPMLINKDISKVDRNKRVEYLLDIVEIENRSEHFPRELSGGEQQRIAIARALANNPDILLADEPTGSLDPENEENILELLRKLSKEGKCIIIVTHSNIVKKYVDVVLELKNGKLEEAKNDRNINK